LASSKPIRYSNIHDTMKNLGLHPKTFGIIEKMLSKNNVEIFYEDLNENRVLTKKAIENLRYENNISKIKDTKRLLKNIKFNGKFPIMIFGILHNGDIVTTSSKDLEQITQFSLETLNNYRSFFYLENPKFLDNDLEKIETINN
jgi:hypothetical protein